MSSIPPSSAPPSEVASVNGSDNNTGGDWRVSVQQSYRNAEVRQIAKVLASLEPGASEASKLRLAMQFEDSIFKVGTSLADYHKKLTKRLKKLQKNYKPTVDANAATQEKEQAVQSLISKYGDAIKYILDHAEYAVQEMENKYGEEKAKQLQQHTDSVKLWAADLGLDNKDNSKPNYNMSEQHLEKLTNHLEKRLENIRSHTVKLADPDLFLLETIQKVENDFKDKGTRIVRVQAENMQKRYEQLQKAATSSGSTNTNTTDNTSTNTTTTIEPEKMMTQALERASKPVPLVSVGPSLSATTSSTTQSQAATTTTTTTTQPQQQGRQVRSKVDTTMNDKIKAALVHLDKMRAASTVVLAYLCTSDKYSIPRNTLSKAHEIAKDGMDFVQVVVKEHRDEQSKQMNVQLHDAWIKQIIIPPKDSTTISTENNEIVPTTTKPIPIIVVRSRVLLTAGRKTPSNLLPALKHKEVTLIRPPPTGSGTYLKLKFGNAFTMIIYMVPLLVTIRALPAPVKKITTTKDDEESTDSENNMVDNNNDDEEELQCASWIPLHSNIAERGNELIVGGTVKGDYQTIGYIVEERLRDASAHATKALRTCFANNIATLSSTAGDFEIELIEASALLEFIQLARDTYMPG